MVEVITLTVADGPAAFGLDSYQWVSIAMLVLIGVFVWKKVPGMIVGGLDTKIAEIKQQLDEAKALRAEAEGLRDEYAAKIAGAEKDAEAMMEGAQREADAILTKAEADSEAMVARRKRMAEDKIAAAEREAVDGVREAAANAAATASRSLIADRHDGEADKVLADEVIASL
ncbi:F0F1 ATP synthase subunit B family protein [Erythrobacter sp. Alg231-14]|uniref:F0F1 ATP synthase subunit B family protein n=1 Tax=Erythrobacter sp. Alg231-14 TaxID=1922225 RepID=UPI000D55FDD5